MTDVADGIRGLARLAIEADLTDWSWDDLLGLDATLHEAWHWWSEGVREEVREARSRIGAEITRRYDAMVPRPLGLGR